jgi:hypothetical protein
MKLKISLITTIFVGLALVTLVSASYLLLTAQSNLTILPLNYWTQTSQGDFASDDLNNVDIISTSGDVKLGFYDNFDLRTAWSPQSGTWIIEDGKYVGTVNSASSEQFSINGDSSWTDYTVRGRVLIKSGTGSSNEQVGLIFRYSDADNWYAAKIVKAGSVGQLEFMKRVGGTPYYNLATYSFSLNEDQWYDLKVNVTGSSIKIYLDGILRIDFTDTSLSNGKIGTYIAYDLNSVGHFDDIQVIDNSGNILFEDNFDWKELNGTWAIENKEYSLQTSGDEGWSYFNDVSNHYSVDFDIEFLTTPADGVSKHGGVMIFANDKLQRYSTSGYTVDWIDRDSGYRIIRWDSGSYTILSTFSASVNENEWYHWKIIRDGSVIALYVNGTNIGNATDSTYNSGFIGLWGYSNNQHIHYDNIAVLAPSGTLLSLPYDTTYTPTEWVLISWNAETPSGTSVKFRTRTSSDGSTWSSWSSNYTVSGSSILSSNDRWIQYEATLETTNPAKTPILHDVSISYHP